MTNTTLAYPLTVREGTDLSFALTVTYLGVSQLSTTLRVATSSPVGGAAAGTDFGAINSISSFSISQIPARDYVERVTITIIDDVAPEGDEFFNINVSSTGRIFSSGVSSIVLSVTVIDNDFWGSDVADSPDFYSGTSFFDEVRLFGGNDAALAAGGNDIVFGGAGDDYLMGGATYDAAEAGTGADTLYGDDGSDLIFGQDGNDTLSGGTGVDYILGGTGNDAVTGGEGDDFLFGGAGWELNNAGAGNDTISGGNGTDFIAGGDGTDTLNGEAGNDLIYGGAGGDTINGGFGDDFLFAGAGNDVLSAGGGLDFVYGDDGADRLNVIAGTAGTTFFYADAADTVRFQGFGAPVDTFAELQAFMIPDYYGSGSVLIALPGSVTMVVFGLMLTAGNTSFG